MKRAALLLAGVAMGAAVWAAPPPEWSRPFPAHKIAGNVYFVGTEDLACFLITGPNGHILINTGLKDSVPMIQESVGKLGFQMKDIKILLTMQAHYDHTAGLAAIQRMTGAKMFATAADAPTIEDGGKSDPYLNGPQYSFEPVKVDRRLKDGEVVSLGPIRLKVLLTPGHTPGSVSYSTTVTEDGKPREVLFVNMPSVVMPLVGNTKYPGIVKDFEMTIAREKALTPGIWVAGHGSQYGLAAKHKAGSFVDPDGYKNAVDKYAKLFRQELKVQSEK